MKTQYSHIDEKVAQINILLTQKENEQILINKITPNGERKYNLGFLKPELSFILYRADETASIPLQKSTYLESETYQINTALWKKEEGNITIPLDKDIVDATNLTLSQYKKAIESGATIVAVGYEALSNYYSLMEDLKTVARKESKKLANVNR